MKQGGGPLRGLLFNALQALDHVDLAELEEHEEVDQHGEEHGQQDTVEVGIQADGLAEHDHVHLAGADDELVQHEPDPHAQHHADEREPDVFPVDVGGDFAVVEAEDLERRELPAALDDGDVVEVVEHDE